MELTPLRLLSLFGIVWGGLWLSRPSFAYKYNPRTGTETYDYTALFTGALIGTITITGIWYFLS